MKIIPAIDILKGRCVRLLQGDPKKETHYSDSPVEVGLRWQNEGAELLHLVDLDAAFEGSPKNMGIIQELCQNLNIPIQLGGGIRSIETIEKYLELGVSRLILSTAGYEDRLFLAQAIRRFEEKILLAIDVVDSHVAIHGWKTVTSTSFYEFALEFQNLGGSEIIATDIRRDGSLEGINVNFYREALKKLSIPVIASGGLSSLEDIKTLLSLKGLGGVICGKALYENHFQLKEALQLL